jgi:hypothetical protein
MTPRDDKVWRLVVDDCRIRPHEVRQMESSENAPVSPTAADDLAAAVTAGPRTAASAHPRALAAGVLALAAVSIACVGALVIWPRAVPTLSDHELSEALAAECKQLQDDDYRAKLLPVLLNDSTYGVGLVKELLNDAAYRATAAKCREQILDALYGSSTRPIPAPPQLTFIPLYEQAMNGASQREREDALASIGVITSAAVRRLRLIMEVSQVERERKQLRELFTHFGDQLSAH